MHGDDFNNVSGGSVNPFAGVIDAGVGADGFYQAFGGGDNALGLFDDKFEGRAKSEIALFEKVQRARMSVDGGGAACGVELPGDELHLAPLTESFFNGVALGMMADGATALVMGEVNFSLSFWARWFSGSCGTEIYAFSDSLTPGFPRV